MKQRFYFWVRNFAEMQKKTLLQAIFTFFLKKIAKLFLNNFFFFENRSPHLKVEFSLNLGSIFLNDFFLTI